MDNTIIKPTKKHARKVLQVVDCGLVRGMGRPEPGNMCVEAAVCYALDLPHGDNPQCVGYAVRAVKIALNDAMWSSNEARAKGMRAVAIAQLGSNEIDQVKFCTTVAELIIRRIVPMALRAAASINTSMEHRQKLNEAADRCEREGSAKSAKYAAKSAEYAAKSAAEYAAKSAADAMYMELADIILEALKICKSPGVKWLDLLDEVSATK